MDQKNRPWSFLDLLEHMKSTLGAAREAGGSIEERQKSLTEQDASPDEVTPRGDDEPER